MNKKLHEEEKIEHPSFGVAIFHRIHGGGGNLFQSHIDTGTSVRLTISRAYLKRHLSNDWIHGADELIEVEMSSNQFAELITHMNVGSGIPCTIRHVGMERMPEPEYVNRKAIFDSEFKEKCNKSRDGAKDAEVKINELLQHKAIPKKVREEINVLVQGITNVLINHLPFIQQQFSETMDKVTTEAKAEVANFVDSKIRSLGINALESEIAKAIAAPVHSPVFITDQRNEE